jgi:hypothetical protein
MLCALMRRLFGEHHWTEFIDPVNVLAHVHKWLGSELSRPNLTTNQPPISGGERDVEQHQDRVPDTP